VQCPAGKRRAFVRGDAQIQIPLGAGPGEAQDFSQAIGVLPARMQLEAAGRIKQNKRLQLDDEQSAALSRRSWNVPARMTQRSAEPRSQLKR
jgi:hypothetical protein